MFDILNLRSNAASFSTSPEFQPYSKVIIQVTEELSYTAGNDTGRTMTLSTPWGTQQMAENILASLSNFQYQPYEAGQALTHPAVELGDGVTIKGIYSGIYTDDTTFGPLYYADISAPEDEEIDHEYPYEPPEDRKVTRDVKGLKASLKITAEAIVAETEARTEADEKINSQLSIQADEISAKVSKTGGDASSFGWVLDESSWTIKAGSSTILKATKDGLEVKGKITATSGTIGGFTINKDYISYNNQTWGGTNTRGIYIGPSGIQLGKNFKVDSNGNLTAASGSFTGTVQAGKIQYGGSNGTFDGYGLTGGTVTGGWGGAIGGGTITTANTAGGINASLGYADFANGVFNGWNTAGYVKASYGYFTYIVMGGGTYAPRTYAIPGADGLTYYVNCIGRVY